jgi:hypothetical protein
MEYYLLSNKWLAAWKSHVGMSDNSEKPENP